MDGTLIIIACAFGLVVLVAYLVYRINRYKMKAEPVDRLSRDISSMERDNRRSPEKGNGPSIDVPIVPQNSLLIILGRDGRKPWMKTVKERLSSGLRVVVVTLKDPSSVRSRYRGDTRFIWLDRSTAHGRTEDVEVVNPTNLSKLLQEIEDNIGRGGLVLFDGFEEVLGANESSRVIRFLRMLDESCSKGGYSAVVPAGYRAVPQRVRVQLTEAFETVVI